VKDWTATLRNIDRVLTPTDPSMTSAEDERRRIATARVLIAQELKTLEEAAEAREAQRKKRDKRPLCTFCEARDVPLYTCNIGLTHRIGSLATQHRTAGPYCSTCLIAHMGAAHNPLDDALLAAPLVTFLAFTEEDK